MSISRLTPKQEKFCQNIVSGMDGKTSYLNSYNTNNEQVAYIESLKLMKRDDITERIKELRKPIINAMQNKVISEREKIKCLIWDRIDICTQKGDEVALARYMDILNKMNSEYININRNIETNETPVTQLSNNDLENLIAAV